MKTKLLLLFLFSNISYAEWNCKNIDSTFNIVQTQGCESLKICVGYANCVGKNDKVSTVKVICRSEKGECPDANTCLEEAFGNKSISIAVQEDRNPNGLYRFCNSSNELAPLRGNRTDVVNSRFCNTISDEYDKTKSETVSTMTGVEGGGSQLGTSKGR